MGNNTHTLESRSPSGQSSGFRKTPVAKINYLDHLKVLLTILVVLHHAFITYGAPGGWYFQQKSAQIAALFPMTVFVATNQAFFMGFFFFMSALFVESSYQKKGGAKFLTDRLKRLGIPLVFYSLILSPILNYIVVYYGYGRHYSFIEYMRGYHHWIDFGVLWFVAALLIFNLFYVLFKSVPGFKLNINYDFPYGRSVIIAGILLGLCTFLTRLIFPVGWSLSPLGFQLGHFPQYILLFIAGIIASRNNWLDQLDFKKGKTAAFIARLLIFIILPILFVISIIYKIPGSSFSGGWNVISFSYSLWEQITGLLIIAALLSIAKFKWNNASTFWNRLSANAFGVYIFHPVVLISLSLLVQSINIEPAIKLLFVGPMAVVLTFLLVSIIKKIPLVNNVI
ncbi:MAG TPA: acyltransferase [Mucilaginibacter sp.]